MNVDVDAELEDVTGAVVLVTGATSGIGREAALALADLGATVLVHGRDRDRGRAAVDEIEESTAGEGSLVCADFASLDEVRDLAAAVRDRHDRLDVLVNNAGVFAQERRETADGHEYTFGVNHLAGFLLTRELVGPLVAAGGRVVTVSSALHRRGTIDFDDLHFEGGYDGRAAYARSKLANVLFTYELADRLAGTGVTANALHPGAIPGSRFDRNLSLPYKLAFRALALLPGRAKSPAEGAETVVYLAASPEVEGVTGRYFVDCEETRSSSSSHDEELRVRLWTASADLVGVDPGLPVESTAPAEE